jgi:hypothetical protein
MFQIMVPEELGMYALIDSCDQPKISNMFLGVHMNSLQNPCWLMIEGDYIIKIYQTCFFDVRHKLYTGMIGFGIFSQSGVHVKSCEATTKPQVVGRLRETVLDGFITYSISVGIYRSIRLIYIYMYNIYIYICSRFFHNFSLMFFGRATYVLRSWRSCNGSTPSIRRNGFPVGAMG